MTLEVGTYQNLRLEILDENTDDSYVLEIGDAERKLLKVPSDELKLGGFEVTDDGAQTFVIEFNLTRSMTYNPTPVRYILKPRGVRVVDVEAAALVRGAGLADLLADCDSEVSTNLANRVYLYEGHGLDVAKLGDAFDPEIDGSVPAGTVEPFVSGVLDENDEYELAFVPSGDYTLAFSCHAAADDASLLDGIVIPAPENQLAEITLEAGDELVCDFDLGGVVCM